MITFHEYTGFADLRRMQALVQRTWSALGQCHIGDLAWGRAMHLGREPEWPTALWLEGDVVRAWGWALPPAELNFSVDPGYPELVAPVLRWFEDAIGPAHPPTVIVTDTCASLIAELRAAGYREQADAPYYLINQRSLADLPPVTAPAGYRLRPVAAVEAAARAEVHRAAFAPSRVTAASYAQVMRTWPYRHDLDWVAAGPDGALVAFCLVWLDPVNLVGELEPVGTHPDHRRRGLAPAVCLAALHALRAAGGNRAIVVCRGDGDEFGACRLYRGLGFRPVARTLTFAREPASATPAPAATGD